MQKLAVLLAGAALLLTLTGCGSSPKGAPAVAQAASGFRETIETDTGATITLSMEPVKIGENRLAVTIEPTDIVEAEAQLVMASMGHGGFVDLTQVEPGRYEGKTSLIDMEGRWLVRIVATRASGERAVAMFQTLVPAQ